MSSLSERAREIDDEKQFRVENGYHQIAQVLYDEAVAGGAKFYLNTVVEDVIWKRNEVEVVTTTGQRFKARRLLVTLPLSLLQNSTTGERTGQKEGLAPALRFTPLLTEHQHAADKLAMGHVVKVVLRFREPFWEDLAVRGEDDRPASLKDLTFIHAPSETLPPAKSLATDEHGSIVAKLLLTSIES